MSSDILVLNEAGEEIQNEARLAEFGDEEPSYKQPKNNKKGFRIDDILFSVSNNALRNTTCLSVVSSSPPSSESSICSSNSSSMEEMSQVLYLQDNHPNGACRDMAKGRNSGANSPTLLQRTRSRSLSPTLVHSASNYSRLCSESASLYSSASNDAKKPRTSFSPDQIQALEDSFQDKRYLNHTERMILAEELNLTDCQIKTWFQNRRMKMKRQYKEAVDKGYIIPYHPYPFPRYSRLTPAHFAPLPTLNSRRFVGKHNNNSNSNKPYQTSSSNNLSACHCCSNSRTYGHGRDSFIRGNPPSCTQANCSDFLQCRLRRGSEVLPNRRSVERRDLQYENEFGEYFRHPNKNTMNNDWNKKFP